MRARCWLVVLVGFLGCRARPAERAVVAAPDAGAPRPTLAERRGPITGYSFALAQVGAELGLRVFEQAGRRWRLVVDPTTLRTRVVADEGAVALSWADVPASPWATARLAAEQHDAVLQDSGLTHVLPKESGVVLTVDLCPSRRHFDFRIVEALLAEVAPVERPVPIAFAVSGVWLQEHPDDLARLRALDGASLAITWINHSMHHRYDPKAPLTRNFLLEPGTDLTREVLDAEVTMLERGLTPSAYFRFPGLVSEPTLVRRVADLGLIVVGSDAWLAKGERAHRGSIVLVHGNGNEPQGVADFVRLLGAEHRALAARQFLLLDLSEALTAD